MQKVKALLFREISKLLKFLLVNRVTNGLSERSCPTL